MDYKKLLLGLSILCLAVGVLLVLFAPGGFLNRPGPQVVDLVGVRLEAPAPGPLDAPGPVSGFVLMLLGAVGLIVRWSLKPAERKPDPLSA